MIRPDGTNRQRVTNDCRILGTLGNDVLHGSFSQIVLGLAGNDRLYANDPAAPDQGDTLDGGLGNDGQGGDDVIRAADGQRDWISCGTGHDVVYADRSDVVAKDCDIIHRS